MTKTKSDQPQDTACCGNCKMSISESGGIRCADDQISDIRITPRSVCPAWKTDSLEYKQRLRCVRRTLFDKYRKKGQVVETSDNAICWGTIVLECHLSVK